MKYCFLALFFLSQNLFAMSNPGKPFGQTPAGESVTLYTLKNAKGMEVHIMNYGGIIQKILTPDRNGKVEDVVLGFETLQEYIKDTPYFGAVVGRFGNRIANPFQPCRDPGRFSVAAAAADARPQSTRSRACCARTGTPDQRGKHDAFA